MRFLSVLFMLFLMFGCITDKKDNPILDEIGSGSILRPVHISSIESLTKDGPFKTTDGYFDVEKDGKVRGYNIYYPKNIQNLNYKFPIIAWGNGTGAFGSFGDMFYKFILPTMASHGYVVVASTSAMSGSGKEMKTGLDKIIQFNSDPGNKFYQKIMINNAGVMGHSQGGMGAAKSSSHSSVKAVVNLMGLAMNVKKPMANITGSMDFMNLCVKISHITAKNISWIGSIKGTDHIGLGGNKGKAEIQQAAISWFDCYLKDSQASCDRFKSGGYFDQSSKWSGIKRKKM